MSKEIKSKEISNNPKYFNFLVPFFLIITNMVGTGVFTSLGFQVAEIPSASAILLLWLIGGIISLTGALCYAEIAVILNRSGGEYNYLTEIYHPALGFLAGWTSIIVGFSASLSAAAIAIGSYTSQFIALPQSVLSSAFLALVMAIQLFGYKVSAFAISFFTVLKLFLILTVCALPLLLSDFKPSSVVFFPSKEDLDLIFNPAFAVSLIYVSYSYSGWNSSAYIAGLIKNPEKNLPRSLIFGTIFVTVVYLIINAFFLYSADFQALSGQVNIGHTVMDRILGENGAVAFSLVLSLILFSSMNGMLLAGTKVIDTICEDYTKINFISSKNKKGTPYLALILQGVIAFVMLHSASFASIVKYAGTMLAFFSLLTVLGLFRLKNSYKDKSSYKTWGYPLTPLIFISFNIYMIVFMSINNPWILLYCALTCLSGLLCYTFLDVQQKRPEKEHESIQTKVL